MHDHTHGAQANGFPEFASRFAEDGVDGDCVVGLKPLQLRVLQRLCLGVQSERPVQQLMGAIQAYRADGVTYGVSWQTNPLVSCVNCMVWGRCMGMVKVRTLSTSPT